MKQKLSEIFNNILNSLNTNASGFSARKLSAFVVIVMVVITHIKWFKSDKWEYLGEVLAFDYMFILTCLGLTTWQSIKEKSKE